MTLYRFSADDRELAAILAGLRLLQGSTDAHSHAIELVVTDGGRFPRLSAEEIDALCERLNCR